MLPFSPRRFAAFATELSKAIMELSHERQHRIEQLEIRRRYGVRHYTWEDHMSTPISRLKDKLIQARGVAQRVATDIEAEADALIAEEDSIKSRTAEAFAPHKAILTEAGTELQAIKDALNLMSNGGPPLDDAAPIVAVSTIAPATSLQLPVNEIQTIEQVAPVSFISTPVDDTGAVDRIRLNSAQTG